MKSKAEDDKEMMEAMIAKHRDMPPLDKLADEMLHETQSHPPQHIKESLDALEKDVQQVTNQEVVTTEDDDAEQERNPREKSFWLLVYNTKLFSSQLKKFSNRTEIALYLRNNPHCSLDGDFILRGYPISITKFQQISF